MQLDLLLWLSFEFITIYKIMLCKMDIYNTNGMNININITKKKNSDVVIQQAEVIQLGLWVYIVSTCYIKRNTKK